MKTALSIVQSVLKRSNLPFPTALVGVTDPNELQLVELLVAVCEDLRREGPFRQQVVTYEFDTVASTNTYPLPGDYYEAVPFTQYNQDTEWRLLGPLTDSEFMAFKEGEAATPTEYVWRIIGFDENSASTSNRQFEIFPVPAVVENLVFQHITKHLFIPPNWAISTVYAASAYVNVNGRIYQESGDGGTSSSDTADAPSGVTAGQTDNTCTWDYVNAAYDTLITDSDLVIFDDDLVKLGLRAKYFEDNDGALADKAYREFNKKIARMRFRWEGQTRVRGDRRSNFGRHRPYVSPGSWSL